MVEQAMVNADANADSDSCELGTLAAVAGNRVCFT